MAIAKAAGFVLSADDLKQNPLANIDEAELEAVAGGGMCVGGGTKDIVNQCGVATLP